MLTFFALFMAVKVNGQYFSVIKISVDRMERLNLCKDNPDKNGFFKIIFKGDTSDIAISNYSKMIESIKNSGADKILLIKELLKFKGDKRICCIPIRNYNPALSQILNWKVRYYSIQIEALFIINQLYFEKPYYFSPYPALYKPIFKKIITVRGLAISRMFTRYEKWLEGVEEMGFEEAISRHKEPNQNWLLQWYSSAYPWSN